MTRNNPPHLLGVHLRTLERSFDDLKLALPAPVATAAKAAAALVAAYDDRPAHDKIEAVMLAIADGNDPAEDPRVQAAVAWAALGPTVDRAVPLHAAAGVARVTHTHADAITALLAGPFDRAATALAEEHATLDGLALDDLDEATRRGPKAAAALARARWELLPTIGHVIDARTALAALVDPWGRAPTAVEARLAWCVPDTAKWVASGLDRVAHPAETLPYAVLTDGHKLGLATLTEYATRISAVIEAKTEAENGRVRKVAEANRRPSYLPKQR